MQYLILDARYEKVRQAGRVRDSAVLTAVNTGMVTSRDFVRAGGAVALTAGGRKAFFRAYEMRMDPGAA